MSENGERPKVRLVPGPRQVTVITTKMIPAVWLELEVTFPPGTPPAAVVDRINRLTTRADRAAPTLALGYYPGGSKGGEGDRVVFALRPRHLEADTRARLDAAVEAIREATGVPVRVAA